MMNKMMKKIAIAAAAMTLTATSALALANDGMGIESMNVSVDSSIHQQMYVIAQSGANVRTEGFINVTGYHTSYLSPTPICFIQ